MAQKQYEKKGKLIIIDQSGNETVTIIAPGAIIPRSVWECRHCGKRWLVRNKYPLSCRYCRVNSWDKYPIENSNIKTQDTEEKK